MTVPYFTSILFLQKKESKPLFSNVHSSKNTEQKTDKEKNKARAKIHFLCGQNLVEAGCVNEAIKQFGKVLELDPTDDVVGVCIRFRVLPGILYKS